LTVDLAVRLRIVRKDGADGRDGHGADERRRATIESERLAALVPDSTVTFVPGAGHLVIREWPAVVAALLTG